MITLPPEVLQRALILSTPPPSLKNNDRAKFLLSLCHVHSSLTPLVQRLLFSHPVFRSRKRLELFLETVEGNDNKFGSWVRSFRIRRAFMDYEDHSVLVLRVLRACTELEEVRLIGITGVDFANFARLKSKPT